MPIGKNKNYEFTWKFCKKTELGGLCGFVFVCGGLFCFFFSYPLQSDTVGKSRHMHFPQSYPEWEELLYFSRFLDKLKLWGYYSEYTQSRNDALEIPDIQSTFSGHNTMSTFI